jgi:hypothetical protein
VLVVSDDGVTTMFENDERGRSGWDVAAAALRAAGGGGTLVLNLPEHWERAASQADADRERARKALEQLERTAGAGAGANLRRVFASGASQVAADLLRARAEGWNVHRVATWDDLLAFARGFSRRAYADDERGAPRRAGEGRA